MSSKRIEEGFLQSKIDLGFIFAGKNYTAKFPYRNLKKIEKVEASCDCLYIDNQEDSDRLIVQYKPKFPKHLIEAGTKQYDSQKSIKVFYRVNSNEEEQKLIVLLLTAKVMK